jgi:hypothetical protein
MRRPLRSAPLLPLVLLLVACGAPAPIEGGLNDAECSDGQDNDQNGRTDCEDPTCAEALACKLDGEAPRPAEFEILDLWFDCDSVGYFFEGTLGGTGYALELNLVNMTMWAQYTERHPFPATPYETDPAGAWERHYVELDTQDWEGHIELGETTFFSCAEKNDLTYTLFVSDDDGAPVGCFAWGADPAGADALQGTSCEVLTGL